MVGWDIVTIQFSHIFQLLDINARDNIIGYPWVEGLGYIPQVRVRSHSKFSQCIIVFSRTLLKKIFEGMKRWSDFGKRQEKYLHFFKRCVMLGGNNGHFFQGLVLTHVLRKIAIKIYVTQAKPAQLHRGGFYTPKNVIMGATVHWCVTESLIRLSTPMLSEHNTWVAAPMACIHIKSVQAYRMGRCTFATHNCNTNKRSKRPLANHKGHTWIGKKHWQIGSGTRQRLKKQFSITVVEHNHSIKRDY